MSEETDRYHELAQQEWRMRWNSLGVAALIIIAAAALILLAYGLYDLLPL